MLSDGVKVAAFVSWIPYNILAATTEVGMLGEEGNLFGSAFKAF